MVHKGRRLWEARSVMFYEVMLETCWNYAGTMLETCRLLSACRYASVPACLCVSACQRAGRFSWLAGFPGRENYVGLMSA